MSFPVVGIGASAGGLEAFSELLTNLPVNTGMAYLLVQHLDPTHNSFLVEILAKQTRIPIEQAREGIEVSPNHVYVLPPNSTLTLGGNRLHLATRRPSNNAAVPSIFSLIRSPSEVPMPSASFFLEPALMGLRACKFSRKQEALSSPRKRVQPAFLECRKALSKPGAWISFCRPAGFAQERVRMGPHPYLKRGAALTSGPEELEADSPPFLENEEQFKRVFRILRNASGVDFAHYKRTTIQRRLSRRMAVHQIESLATYVNLLQENQGEAQALFRDFLICVTSFFRDREMFQALTRKLHHGSKKVAKSFS